MALIFSSTAMLVSMASAQGIGVMNCDGIEYCSSGALCEYEPAGVCLDAEDGTSTMLVCGLESQIAMGTFNSSDCSGDTIDLVDYVSYLEGTSFWDYDEFTITCGCDTRCEYALTREHEWYGDVNCDANDDVDETEVTALGFCQISSLIFEIEYSCADGVLTGEYCNYDEDDDVESTGCDSDYSLGPRYQEITCGGMAVDTNIDYGTPMNYSGDSYWPSQTSTSTAPPEITVRFECGSGKVNTSGVSALSLWMAMVDIASVVVSQL